MKEININSWKRRDIYKVFRSMQFPHFSVNSELDVTALVRFSKKRGQSFHALMLYLVCRAANELPAFRLRLRGKKVVEHESVHIAPTLSWKEDLFTFCAVPYNPDPRAFVRDCALKQARARALPELNLADDAAIGDASIYASSLPWVHLAGATNPFFSAEDCIPRVVWGKHLKRGRAVIMGVSVQCHHALVDGRDVALFLGNMQEMANSAPKVFARLVS